MPIFLVVSLYQIILMLLSNRVKKVVGNLISSHQSSFIPRRVMMHIVLVLNEIMGNAIRNKSECLLVKVDFATTCECISWEYLRYMLGRMNFGSRWLRWMDMLVFSISMFVLINDNPSTDF